jgi:hypothetical protein
MSYTHTPKELAEAMAYLELIQLIAPRKAPATFDPRSADGAPLLDEWSIEEFVSADCEIFWGRVTGHPHLPDGHIVHTSAVIWLDEARGWARTLYRFYRLGTPKHPTEEPVDNSGRGRRQTTRQ